MQSEVILNMSQRNMHINVQGEHSSRPPLLLGNIEFAGSVGWKAGILGTKSTAPSLGHLCPNGTSNTRGPGWKVLEIRAIFCKSFGIDLLVMIWQEKKHEERGYSCLAAMMALWTVAITCAYSVRQEAQKAWQDAVRAVVFLMGSMLELTAMFHHVPWRSLKPTHADAYGTLCGHPQHAWQSCRSLCQYAQQVGTERVWSWILMRHCKAKRQTIDNNQCKAARQCSFFLLLCYCMQLSEAELNAVFCKTWCLSIPGPGSTPKALCWWTGRPLLAESYFDWSIHTNIHYIYLHLIY